MEKEMLKKVRSVKLCLEAHQDNEENSEFADRIADLEDLEKYFIKQIKPLTK